VWTSSEQATLLVFLLLGGAFLAEAGDFCEVCQKPFTNTVYRVQDDYHNKTRLVCKPCVELKVHCLVCGIPVLPTSGLHLAGDRDYCPEDAKVAVLDEKLAAELFDQGRREAVEILAHYPPLPEHSIEIHLVTREDFNREYRRLPSTDDPSTLLGLTRSRQDADSNFVHNIYLLHGVPRDEFLAVCAHEYTHTWLFEREKNARQLHKDTIEGFCELIAYKVVTKLKLERETRHIRENPYSRGQIEALLAAEKEFEFPRLVDWIDDGVDSWVDQEDLNRVLLRRDRSPESPATFTWMPVQKSRVPDQLVLRGLSGTGNRRFALINDATIQVGEETRVRVGASNLFVKCLAISSNVVTLQVRGEPAPRQLQIKAK
jgi:hypothetical protein